MLVRMKGLGHVPRPQNFTIGNELPSEDSLAKCRLALLTFTPWVWLKSVSRTNLKPDTWSGSKFGADERT